MLLLNPQRSVSTQRAETFELLAALCGLVSSDVQAYVHEPGWPYRAEFRASLERVQSLVPGGGAITFGFEGGESLTLGPSEVVDFRVSPIHHRPLWIEVQLRCGSSLWIEQVAKEARV